MVEHRAHITKASRENTEHRVPSSRAHMGSAVAILGSAVVCLVPAALFGTYLGAYPSRMVCTPETGYGSGCDEGELTFAAILFGAVFLLFAIAASGLTKAYRYNLPKWRQWLPFTVFCAVVLLVIVVYGSSTAEAPDEYI